MLGARRLARRGGVGCVGCATAGRTRRCRRQIYRLAVECRFHGSTEDFVARLLDKTHRLFDKRVVVVSSSLNVLHGLGFVCECVCSDCHLLRSPNTGLTCSHCDGYARRLNNSTAQPFCSKRTRMFIQPRRSCGRAVYEKRPFALKCTHSHVPAYTPTHIRCRVWVGSHGCLCKQNDHPESNF